jgi:protein gp37
MSDLFHRDIPVDYLKQVWEIMIEAPQHIYQILTKRPHRAAHLISRLGLPLPRQIWLGVSVENQTFANNRIPALLSIPAAVRFLSCEPLLGPLDLTRYLPGIQWVIDGGESGPDRRPADYDWFRSIRDQAIMSGVPYYHKQGNSRYSDSDKVLDGVIWHQYPEGYGIEDGKAACRAAPEGVATQLTLV